MTKYLLAVLSLTLFGAWNALAQKPQVSITGCYSDLHLDNLNGDVTGTGSFRIKLSKGKYEAFFTELIGDEGAYAPKVRIRNLKVNKPARTIVFDIDLPANYPHHKTFRHVSGQISRRGIKMNWRGHGTEIGAANPYLRRRVRDCD